MDGRAGVPVELLDDYWEDGVVSEHTRTPWQLRADLFAGEPKDAPCYNLNDGWITFACDGPDAKANAAYIVQCVNSHEALVQALKDCLADLELWQAGHPEISASASQGMRWTTDQIIERTKAALAKVTS